MSKKTVAMIGIAVVLGGIYLVWFADFFSKPVVEIAPRVRMSSGRRGGPPEVQVTFSFSAKCQLNEVKVVSVADAETNKYPHALWHMISDSNSIPVKGMVYGDWIKGMKPKIPKGKAEPLEPKTKYRLVIATRDEVVSTADFQVPARRMQ
jgi:hypothetical protein